jgi:uncharacterized protein (TIGR03437 family)
VAICSRTSSFRPIAAICLLAPFCCAQTYTIATVVGGGTTVPTQQPIPAAQAKLVQPTGVAVNAAGNLFTADTAQLTKLSGGSVVALTTTADAPWGVAVDGSGNIYIADAGVNQVHKIDPGGNISNFAGNGTAGSSGDGGPATSAELQNPVAVAVDAAGNVYIADSANHRVRKVSNGVITTFAGGGSNALNGSAPATSVFITETDGVAFDSAGNLYITSRGGLYVYKVTPAQIISIFAGNGDLSNDGDGGLAINAGVFSTTGVDVDARGDVVFASDGGCVIRSVTPDGIIHTIAGNGKCGYSGDGGPATSAELNAPWGLAASGTQIYVADRGNHVVRLLTTGAVIGGPPTVPSGGVVTLNSTANAIQPGAWFSIYGTNLISGSVPQVWSGNYPTTLGDTSVTVDNKPAYLWYAGPTQLNVQAPDDSTRGTVNVTVKTPNGTAASTVTLADQSPAWNLLGDGKHVAGIILRPDGSGAYGSGSGSYDIIGPTGTSLGYKTVAAKAGDTIVLFGNGFGPTSPPIPAGQAYSGPAATAVDNIAVTINSHPVSSSFTGVAMPGLFQFNVTLPSGLGTGDQPLSAMVNGVLTPVGVVIALQ